MIKFYFSGHDYEYEARNALRVFDLNEEYEIKDISFFDFKGLCVVSYLNELSARTLLYLDDKLLYESELSKDDIILEKYSPKKLKKTLVMKTIHNVLKSYYNVNKYLNFILQNI